MYQPLSLSWCKSQPSLSSNSSSSNLNSNPSRLHNQRMQRFNKSSLHPSRVPFPQLYNSNGRRQAMCCMLQAYAYHPDACCWGGISHTGTVALSSFGACSHSLAQPAVILTMIKLDQVSRVRGEKVIS